MDLYLVKTNYIINLLLLNYIYFFFYRNHSVFNGIG